MFPTHEQGLAFSNLPKSALSDYANRPVPGTRPTKRLREAGICQLECGVFGEDMQVVIHNDGPVTLILDSAEM